VLTFLSRVLPACQIIPPSEGQPEKFHEQEKEEKEKDDHKSMRGE